MKTNKETTKVEFIEVVKHIGNFNNWKGFIGLYFTKSEIRLMKKYGVTENKTIKEVYNILIN